MTSLTIAEQNIFKYQRRPLCLENKIRIIIFIAAVTVQVELLRRNISRVPTLWNDRHFLVQKCQVRSLSLPRPLASSYRAQSVNHVTLTHFEMKCERDWKTIGELGGAEEKWTLCPDCQLIYVYMMIRAVFGSAFLRGLRCHSDYRGRQMISANRPRLNDNSITSVGGDDCVIDKHPH